jgi:hypothetical protein
MFGRVRTTFIVAVACVAVAVVVPPALASNRAHYSTGLPELGIVVDFSDTAPLSDSKEVAQAQRVFSYVASLGANAVSLNFPFYMSSQTASTVASGIGTPSPDVLAAIVEVARQDGLTVQLRPDLSELGDDTPKTGNWRGTIAPANPSEWFISYGNWLKPYAIVAKQTGVTSFSIGVELSSLVTATPTKHIGAHNYLTYWVPLTQNLQTILGDRLLYSAAHLNFQSVPGVQFGFDAYNPVTLAKDVAKPTSKTLKATVVSDFVPSISKGFQAAGFASTLNSTRLEEVGIAAVDGAWTQPNNFNYPPNTAVARWVQADYDTAMCNVFESDHMAGIYFYDLDFNTFSPSFNADTAHSLYNWEGTATASSISSCFAQVRDSS